MGTKEPSPVPSRNKAQEGIIVLNSEKPISKKRTVDSNQGSETRKAGTISHVRNSSKVSKTSQVSNTSSSKLYYNQNQKRFLVSGGVYSATNTNTKNKTSTVSSKISNPSVVLKDESSLRSSTIESRDNVWFALLPEDWDMLEAPPSAEVAMLHGVRLHYQADGKEVVRGVISEAGSSLVCMVQSLKRDEMLKQAM